MDSPRLLPPSESWSYETCSSYFATGIEVTGRYQQHSKGVVKYLDHSTHGGMLIAVKWVSTGITALVHPSQIVRLEDARLSIGSNHE